MGKRKKINYQKAKNKVKIANRQYFRNDILDGLRWAPSITTLIAQTGRKHGLAND
jgi:hypothetical protein